MAEGDFEFRIYLNHEYSTIVHLPINAPPKEPAMSNGLYAPHEKTESDVKILVILLLCLSNMLCGNKSSLFYLFIIS
jgi:hypothetical protein